MTVLSVRHLNKTYPAFKLEDVSFTLEPGKITGFIGRNGAGKSTTLNSLFNFVHPDSGEISFFGMDFAGHELEIKQRIGFVSSGVNYYANKKLKTISRVTSSFYNNWDQAAYEKYLAMFHLDENKTPAQLSAGMKVKFALALALSHNADLLILDEPTSGLDPVSREDLLEVFMDLCAQGKTILFSTHITSDLDKCADNIIYIKNGRLIADCSVSDFEQSYRIASFDSAEAMREYQGISRGQRRTRKGCTALISAADAQTPGLKLSPADLESIMIHIEKEAE
ncbi:MAG: ABC transporter ATP-binding protein [Bacillota bacterium]|nr:ABC transporter ATP-binding protein [Bacillota bacterium]